MRSRCFILPNIQKFGWGLVLRSAQLGLRSYDELAGFLADAIFVT